LAQYQKKKKFIKKQYYPGGQKALDKFLRDNIVYPKQALDNKIEGSVYVKYDISTEGNVVKAEVVKGLGYGCDEEAIRLVKMLKYTDAKQKGVHVKLSTKITIHFMLPKSGIIYNYVPTKEREQDKSLTYSYHITINKK